MSRATRRDFCRMLALSAAGQAGLDKFLLPAPPCKDDLTPAVSDMATFRPNAPMRSNLADGLSGVKMTLSGYVTGLTCGRIKGARLDFWQADTRGAYDMTGPRLRGAVHSDSEGRYSIDTIVPGAASGNAKRIHVTITPQGPQAKSRLTTALFFPGDELATKDKSFKPALLLKPVAGVANSYRFDFLLDL